MRPRTKKLGAKSLLKYPHYTCLSNSYMNIQIHSNHQNGKTDCKVHKELCIEIQSSKSTFDFFHIGKVTYCGFSEIEIFLSKHLIN